jgi:hypothetical protein
MNKVRLGRTGLMVSALGFGGIPIQRLTTAEAVAVVRASLDAGINLLDTAHGYSSSEERIGLAIQGRREGLVIATKAPSTDPQQFREQVELSFRRLQVERIDLLQFHGVSSPEKYAAVLAPGGPLAIARALQAAGRIGHIGVTSHNLGVALQMARDNHFETLMFPFNFITREPLDELIPLCRQNDIGFIAMKPVGGGLLWDIEVALKWLRQTPGIVPLVGMQSLEELVQNLAAIQGPAELTADELALIAQRRDELGTRFCRACDYCQPCPQGIAISSVLRIQSFFRRMPADRFYSAGTAASIATAETCIECGECESRCPYDLPIREMLKEQTAWYRQMEATRS